MTSLVVRNVGGYFMRNGKKINLRSCYPKPPRGLVFKNKSYDLFFLRYL